MSGVPVRRVVRRATVEAESVTRDGPANPRAEDIGKDGFVKFEDSHTYRLGDIGRGCNLGRRSNVTIR